MTTNLLTIIIPNPAASTRIRVKIDQPGQNINRIRINVVKSTSYITTTLNVVSIVCNKAQYPFGFNGQMKVDEVAGKGNHNTALYWEYSTQLGRRWNLDPVDQISASNYSVLSGNPIWKNDVLGNTPSTHTDENGSVVEVKNDGNLGIYKHSESEIKSGALNNGAKNLAGSTLYENSFKKGDKIDFGSTRAQNDLESFEGNMKQLAWMLPSTIGQGWYGFNARNGGAFDPKSFMEGGSGGGSQISPGVYVSNRDLGNYKAGAFGRISGMNKEDMMVEYGAFNLASGRGLNKFANFVLNRGDLKLKALNYVDVINKLYQDPRQKTYGEDANSNWFIRLGYEGINNMQKFNANYDKILSNGK